MKRRNPSSLLVAAFTAATLVLATPARAHPGASEASALSTLPIAVSVTASVAAPMLVLSGAATLTIVSVEASADGAVWVLERASDGARASLRLSGALAAGASVAAGSAIAVTALSTGWVLSAAGQAIAFVPNAIGEALLYDQRVVR